MNNEMTLNIPALSNDFGVSEVAPVSEVSLVGLGDVLDNVEKPQEQPEEKQQPDITQEPLKEDDNKLETLLEVKSENKEELLNTAKKYLGDFYDAIEINDGDSVIKADEYIKDVDTLVEMLAEKHKHELEELKANSVSTTNLDALQKDIVNIISKGGNPAELIKVQSDYIQPLSEIDLDTEEGQIEMIQTVLRDGNRTDEEIDILIAGYLSKGILEDKAIESKKLLEDHYQSHLEKVKQAELDRLEQIKTAHKKFSTDVKKEFETLGYNDTTVKKLRSFVSEIKPQGENKGVNMTEMDYEYFKLRNDPKEAALLGLFFYDREKYNETVAKKAVNKEQVKTAKTIIINKQKPISSDNKSVLQSKLDNSSFVSEVNLLK